MNDNELFRPAKGGVILYLTALIFATYNNSD